MAAADQDSDKGIHVVPNAESNSSDRVPSSNHDASPQDDQAKNRPPRNIALVIGVNHYQHLPTLRYAEPDARAMAEALTDPQRGAFDEVIRISQEGEAGLATITERLEQLFSDSSLAKQDTVLIYFSGHGMLAGNVKQEPALYLLAEDSLPTNPVGSALDLEWLRSRFEKLRTSRKVLIVDCCFNGVGKSVGAGAKWFSDPVEVSLGKAQRRLESSEALLMSSRPDGVALETEELGHGVYTSYLLDALSAGLLADINNDGAISAWEAHDYARGKVQEMTAGMQIPAAWIRSIGSDDVFLSRSPAKNKLNRRAYVFDYKVGELGGRTLRVDGLALSPFPRTVAVDAGTHRITLVTPSGKIEFDGFARFVAGRYYTLRQLREEISGLDRQLEVRYITELPVTGRAAPVNNRLASGLQATSAWKLDSTRKFTMTLGGALGVIQGLETSLNPDSGASEPQRRKSTEVNVEYFLGWEKLRWELGGLLSVGARYTFPLDGLSSLGGQCEAPDIRSCGWLQFPISGYAWQSWVARRQLVLVLRQGIQQQRKSRWSPDGTPNRLSLLVQAGAALRF